MELSTHSAMLRIVVVYSIHIVRMKGRGWEEEENSFKLHLSGSESHSHSYGQTDRRDNASTVRLYYINSNTCACVFVHSFKIEIKHPPFSPRPTNPLTISETQNPPLSEFMPFENVHRQISRLFTCERAGWVLHSTLCI